jgi:hypothetical protein
VTPARAPSRPLALALVGLLALGGPGCSFLLVRGPGSTPPPPGTPAQQIEDEGCTDSYGAPVVDVIFATAFAASGVHAAVRNDVDPYFEGTRKTSVALGTLGALVLAASALYGFRNASACRRARPAGQASSIRIQARPGSRIAVRP